MKEVIPRSKPSYNKGYIGTFFVLFLFLQRLVLFNFF